MRRLVPWLAILAIGLVGASTRGSSTGSSGIPAAHFSVTIDGAPSGTLPQDANLIALRDLSITRLRENLPAAWSAATRGLGSLTVLDGKADIPLHLVAATGTSIHKSGSRSGQEIVLYVAEDGRRTTELEMLSTALHELGHIWCCRGVGTSEGHWATALDDGRDFGLNRYGLMNSPVKCAVLPNQIFVCPLRFSDRELASMGFTAPARATPDPCVAAMDRLKAQIDTADRQIRSAKSDLEDLQTKLRRATSELSSYDAYRFSGVPSGLYPLYQSAYDAYTSLAASERRDVADLNFQVQRRNTLAGQHYVNAAGCLID